MIHLYMTYRFHVGPSFEGCRLYFRNYVGKPFETFGQVVDRQVRVNVQSQLWIRMPR